MGLGLKPKPSYLNTYHFIPHARTSELFGDFYGHTPAPALVKEANQAVETGSEPALAAIYDQLLQAEVEHFDESGIRVAGQTQWLHLASTEELTYYEVHPKRGQEAMQAIGLLPNFSGRAVHDHWQSYQTFDNCDHAYCNSHHLRELQFLTDQYQQSWAQQMAQLLLDIKAEVAQTALVAETLPPERITYFEQRYDRILQQGFAANPPPVNPPPTSGDGLSSLPPKTYSIAWTNTNPKPWPLCMTSGSRLTIIWPNGMSEW